MATLLFDWQVPTSQSWGHISDEFEATSGVPQGSHLGPVLFNIFINDIGNGFQSEYLLYADDLKIYRRITSVLDTNVLQSDIDELHAWCRTKLNLNIKKCAVMSFSRSQTYEPMNYTLNDQVLHEVSDIKDLGIIIDNKLVFSKHVEKITLQAFKVLGLITRTCRDFSSAMSIVTLYSALVLPILEYGTIVWSPFTNTLINRVERVQHKFCKFLSFFMSTSDSVYTVEDIRKKFKINKLAARRQIADLTFFYKAMNGLIDSPEVRNSFEFIANRPRLRHNRLVETIKSYKNYVINGPNNRIANLVNNLHTEVNFFDGTLSSFRHGIRKQLLPY